MNDIFVFLVSISFFIWAGRNILFWVSLWQVKEYRLDRLLVHFKETIQGRSIFLSWINLLKWVLLFLYVVTIFEEKFSDPYEIILGIFLIFQGLLVIREVFQRKIKRPVITGKSLLLTLMSFAAIFVLFFFPVLELFLWLLVLDRLIPLVVWLFVFFLAFPTEVHRDFTIANARKKMEEYKNIIVIAVSGSYGKTSTKEYIAQVLSKKYSVVKTPLSNNTPIGIAQTILKKINESTEVFVVEMGAYKKREIEELTQIVHPTMSVTTAISDQHISLYGNLLNVIDSEYELINALPKDGLALFNGNNPLMQELIKRTKIKKVIYQWFESSQSKYLTIGAYNVIAKTNGLEFDAVLRGKKYHFSAPLLGIHGVENILPAIYLADKMGISIKEIQDAVSKLIPPPQTMVKKQLRLGITGIDDTFNASPESVVAAMNYIKLFNKKKFFVLSPLIELGKEAKARHYLIGLYASTTCSYLYLLNNNFSQEIKRGVVEGKGKCKIVILRPIDAAAEIASIAKSGDVVLFEGKEAKQVMLNLL